MTRRFVRKHWGSSPRMRGALCATLSYLILTRIIPAYAGSTIYGLVTSLLWKDHPRVCGEHWHWRDIQRTP